MTFLHPFLRRLASIALILAATSSSATQLTPAAKSEIEHLFQYLATSGCQFNRNGSWYTAEDAVAHLRKKYDYFDQKDQLITAESFIRLAATESSMSGKAYAVKCGDGPEVPSAPWFGDELKRFRAQPKP